MGEALKVDENEVIELPTITLSKRKISPNGTMMEEDYLQVKGKTTKDCFAMLDRIKGGKKNGRNNIKKRS